MEELSERVKANVAEKTTINIDATTLDICEKPGKDGFYILVCPIEGCASKVSLQAQKLKDSIKFSLYSLSRHLETHHSLQTMGVEIITENEDTEVDPTQQDNEDEIQVSG